jgi:hypothetical protein
MSPETTEPFLVTELDTITVMNSGSVAGGTEVLPASPVQLPPQLAGCGVVALAKPLKLEGAAPPLNEFRLAH